ncbi:hypothetical protein, partial [Rhizobium sp. Pop5]
LDKIIELNRASSQVLLMVLWLLTVAMRQTLAAIMPGIAETKDGADATRPEPRQHGKLSPAAAEAAAEPHVPAWFENGMATTMSGM